MIINKSGIAIRINVGNLSIIGRATQGVKLINLDKRNDEIASVCKVISEKEEENIANKSNVEKFGEITEEYTMNEDISLTDNSEEGDKN